MFDIRCVILGFGLANAFFSTSELVEYSNGKWWMFVVTFLLAFPISLFIGRLVREVDEYEESREEPFTDIFDLLPENDGFILRWLIVDSFIVLMVTCSTIVLYTGNRDVYSNAWMLAIIGTASIILAFLYQCLFYKLGKDSFTIPFPTIRKKRQ